MHMDAGKQNNHLLNILESEVKESLLPLLQTVDLPQKKIIEDANSPIDYCYFPISGVASVVAMAAESRQRVEVGLVGRDGMTGIVAILGAESTPNQTIMQISGEGLRVKITDLMSLTNKHPRLTTLFTRYAHAFSIQSSETALTNGKGTLAQRLARWILMADDRIPGHDFHISHEFLALMIGVRRAGVTEALHLLEGQGLIKSQRSYLMVLDRNGLKKIATWTYGVAEAEYKRLFGNPYGEILPITLEQLS